MLGEFAIGKMDNGILKSSAPTAFLGNLNLIKQIKINILTCL